MHLANAYYGHRSVLADYVGLVSELPIWGMLQHGWQPGTGFTPDDPPRLLRRRLRAFVWNRANLEAATAAGYGNIHAIGAPFLYLGPARPERRPTGTLAYPFHGWEKGRVEPFHETYAEQLREREGADATVCLYWLEYADPAILSAYERRDLQVICHGHREGDPSFLLRQHAAISAHRRVVANRVATALWYGGWLGRELEVYGPMAGTADGRSIEVVYARDRQCWPDLFDASLGAQDAKNLAAQELGAEFRRSPEELEDILGWAGARARVAPALATITHGIMREKRRLERW